MPVRGYEWFESLDRYYIAFELAAGGDMFDHILSKLCPFLGGLTLQGIVELSV